MEFFIRQGASDPILKMRLIDDGKNDKSSLNDLLENSDISFEMYDHKTGEPSILNGECLLTTRTKKYDQTTDEYYITYISRTVTQSVNVSSYVSSANSFNGVINIKREENGTNNNDTYNFTLLFKNSVGTTVITKTTGSSIAPLNYTDITLTLNRSEIPTTFDTITTVDVQLTGVDAGFWNGNHGPWVDYIKLNVS